MATKTQGRPVKLTDELLEKIALFKRLGCSDKYSAQAAGISEYTLRDWKQKYPKVREILTQSQADGVAINIGRMNEIASSGNIQAVKWLLNRLDHDEFPKDEYNLNINIKIEDLTDDELEYISATKTLPAISAVSGSRERETQEIKETTYTEVD